MKISNISRNRTELMGLAILMIMLCHNSLIFNANFNHINDILRTFLQIGVDIFFMLSGLGCYYSMGKSRTSLIFYKKRIVRILPTYLFIITIYGIFSCLILKNNILEYLYKYSLISFFLDGNLSEWFVAAILILYLFFPLLYQLINKRKFLFYFLGFIILILSFIISLFWSKESSFYVVNEIFIARIPIFLVGICIGNILYNNKDVNLNNVSLIIMLVTSVILYVVNYNCNLLNMLTITKYIFIPIVISLTVLLNFDSCNSFEKASKFLGSITLEIYLIHEKLMGITYFVCKHFFSNESMLLLASNIMAIVLAVILAKIIHQITKRFLILTK